MFIINVFPLFQARYFDILTKTLNTALHILGIVQNTRYQYKAKKLCSFIYWKFSNKFSNKLDQPNFLTKKKKLIIYDWQSDQYYLE